MSAVLAANDDDKQGATDAEIIEEAKKYMELVITADGDNRSNALADLQFLSGDQWPEDIKRLRTLDGRPCLTINKLPTFLHQVTNDQRQNVPGIKVHPVDSVADPEVAKIEQGMIRSIEYRSNADVAYDTAVNSAAAIGFGYWRLVTDYCKPDSFDQDIKFKRIRNPFTVYFDPLSEEPDGSDQTRCLISAKIKRTAFRMEYPSAECPSADSLPRGTGDGTTVWLDDEFIRVGEYYRIEYEKATLVQLTNGETGWKKDLVALPEGVTIKAERESFKQKVMLYKLTALEILERTEIKCQWIPVFPVYGDELDIDGKVLRSGLVRNAKDPATMYNYWMTSATEEVAMRNKTPYIGAEGQFDGYEETWGQANNRNFPFLEYKPVSLDGSLAPPPQRQGMADIPSGILAMAMHANDNIKATTGLFDSSLGARGNATSGVQERAQQHQGDVSNFHFTDNLNRSVRQCGRCLVSMIPHYYDAKRIVRTMGEDDTMGHAEINADVPPEKQKADPKTGAVQTVLNDMTVGDYDVTIQSGPSYSTLRQEASDNMIEMGGKWPKLMEVAGDLVVKSQDWPGANEIAERIAKTIPANIRGDEEETDEPMVQTPRGPIPLEQAGQMLAEMDQQIQEMGAQLQEATSGIAKAKIDAQSRENVAEINAVAKNDVAELQGLIQLLLARIPPPIPIVQEALTTGSASATPSASGAEEIRAMPEPGMDSAQPGQEEPAP